MATPSRPSRTTRPITVILRAVPGAAAAGRLAGWVEVVDTGETVHVTTVDELVALLVQLAAQQFGAAGEEAATPVVT